MRKQLSKKLRFEVFKRDGFVCQYCGAHPPNVALHVDHIQAVANGGDNEIDNLITSCQACNLGKGANLLHAIPEGLKGKAERIAEAEAQIKGYQVIMMERRIRIEDDAYAILEKMRPNDLRVDQRDFASVKNFVEKLGFDEVFSAAEITLAKGFRTYSRDFRYFCGVCINKMRALNA